MMECGRQAVLTSVVASAGGGVTKSGWVKVSSPRKGIKSTYPAGSTLVIGPFVFHLAFESYVMDSGIPALRLPEPSIGHRIVLRVLSSAALEVRLSRSDIPRDIPKYYETLQVTLERTGLVGSLGT
jgi:hypothetical protein